MTLQGDTILAMPNSSNNGLAEIGAFSGDGRTLFIAPSHVGNIMRAVSLDGGKSVERRPKTNPTGR